MINVNFATRTFTQIKSEGKVTVSTKTQKLEQIKSKIEQQLASLDTEQRKQKINSIKRAIKVIQENINHEGSIYFNDCNYYDNYNQEFFHELLKDTTFKSNLEFICTHRNVILQDRKLSFYKTNYTSTAIKLRQFLDKYEAHPGNTKKNNPENEQSEKPNNPHTNPSIPPDHCMLPPRQHSTTPTFHHTNIPPRQHSTMRNKHLNTGINNYTNEHIEAAKVIQKIFKLKSLWREFIKNPCRTYSRFSNDRIANEMFGKHIATFKFEDYNNHITTNTDDSNYNRSKKDNEPVEFFMSPNPSTWSKNTARDGIGTSLWRKTIDKFKTARQIQNKNPDEILLRYAKNGADILRSPEFTKLSDLRRSLMSFALHARELYLMIKKVCENTHNLDNQPPEVKARIEGNYARLHMFLDMLVHLHNNTHEKFTAILEPIIHEITLLVHDKTELTDQPFIRYSEFNEAIKNEFLGTQGTFFESNTNDQIMVNGYPANSGMHANILGLEIIKIINNNAPSVYEYRGQYDQYYEIDQTRQRILGNNSVKKEKSDTINIHAINGSVMDGFNPYTSGVINLNNFVDQLPPRKNNEPNFVLMDTTNCDYDNIKLNNKTLDLVGSGALTIILWESWQKMGLLGTDQAQYGRVVVLSSKSNLQKLEQFNKYAEKDIINLDMQIGALFQICRLDHNGYRKFNFNNGKKMREIVWADNSKEATKIGPFLTDNDLALQKTIEMYPKIPIYFRDSFGFNNSTYTYSLEGFRMSAGSEPTIDIEILSIALKALIENTKNKNTEDKEVCLTELITVLNEYFSETKNKFSRSNSYEFEDFKKLVSFLLIATIIISDIDYHNISCSENKSNQLDTNNIIYICKAILQGTNCNYEKLIKTHLAGSKKSISIITNLFLKIKTANAAVSKHRSNLWGR